MKALMFDRFGEPQEVLQWREAALPEPQSGQVRVRMLASPINPSDVMTVRGIYGRLPQLPATAGFEGVGVIDKVGGGLLATLRGLRPGRRVVVLNSGGGNWAEAVVVSARHVVPIPDDIPDEQAAVFFVNPATAVVMTQHVLQVPQGAWLIQTAAGSALGRMVIKLGKHLGFRTINVVRRRALEPELRALGADAVLVSGEDDLPRRVSELTQGAQASCGLDPVGGPVVGEVIRCLAPRGRLLLYGTLANEPIPLESRALMVGQKSIEGFWLSEWVQAQGPLRMLGLFRQITRLLQRDILTSPIAQVFDIAQYREAFALADQPARGGKVLLRISLR